jgi:cephalosporin hydroxylase
MTNGEQQPSRRGLRRSVAAYWDRVAVTRATLVVDRGRRPGADPETAGLARDVVARVVPTGSDLTSEQRWLRDQTLLELLPEVDTAMPDEVTDAVSQAFARLYQPTAEFAAAPTEAVRQTIIDQFHQLYYHLLPRVWERTYYRGHRVLKLTSDMWMYRTIIDDLKPGLIIETGTRFGGSALWFADQLELLGHGKVVTIDIDDVAGKPMHPRITHLLGSSSDPVVADQVRAMLPTDGSPVLIVLDSDHRRDHVLAEMRLFGPMVTPGSLMIVEDTNINGHPVFADFGPGPYEAVEDFMQDNDDFEVDESYHLYYVTQNPRGYLRRKQF